MSDSMQVTVPDIGDFDAVEVIEVLVRAGDQVEAEQSLITLESDKASMEVPAPSSGKVKAVAVKVGDRVAMGDAILELEPSADGDTKKDVDGAEAEESPASETGGERPADPGSETAGEDPPPSAAGEVEAGARSPAELPYASPSIRKLAREKGIDLSAVEGTGRKSRILAEDVERAATAATGGAGTVGLPPMPEIDFAQFGAIEHEPLTKINRLTGENLHRSWLHVPHVTQFDEADITDLEAFRKASKGKAEARDTKLTFVSFLLVAAAAALREFPRFNASLSPSGQELILKRYINIGVAVDTPKGLVVPVIRDVDRKHVLELAEELAAVSARARNGKLTMKDIQGGSFTISSLGGIGGTAFTPIVNAPEVAILAVSRAKVQPVWQDGEFLPRLMLPLSLSYDHRVIDGAAAARFTTYLGEVLSDIRNLLL